MTAPIRVETLPNGLTVLLRPLRVAPVAEIQVWAQVGSADEREGEAGLAHFHEHMLFKGTPSRSVGEIAGAIEGAGGRINAYTSFDVTNYHVTLPSDVAGLGVDVLADVVQHSIFDPQEVANEIEVVLEEIGRSEDDPHHVLSDLLFRTSYRTHPYRAPILGTRESVSSLTSEKLLAFYRRWYAPDNLLLVAVGDLDPDEILERARAAFAEAKPAGIARHRPQEPAQSGLRCAVAGRPFERACLDLSWPVVPFAHPDAPLLDLLAFVLGEGESARLHRHLKEERGLADRIDASCYTPLDAGLFGATADLEADRCSDVITGIVRETERVRRELVSDEELDRARRNFLASQAWERESVSGMARKLGSGQVLTGNPEYEEIYLARVREASREDLLRVAEEWLPPERLNVAAVLPEADAAELGEERIADAVEAGAASVRRLFQPPGRAAQQGRIHAFELESGVQLFVVPRRDVPVVAARAALLGGQLLETEETAGLTTFLSSMWLRGTTRHSSSEFAARVESLAADVDGFAGRNSCGATLDCTADVWDEVLELFADSLLTPAFAAEEIERERRETLAALARREDRLSARVFDLFSQAHFKRHPYRLPLPGTPETVARIDAEALRAHQQRLVTTNNLVIAVVGDVDPEQAAADISRRFAELPPGDAIEAQLPEAEPLPTEVRKAIEHKDRAQAHLVMGFRGLTVHDPDRDALEVLCQVLTGQGGRLFLELRDRQGLAYTVSAINVEGVAPGFFSVYIGTAPEKFDDALEGIRSELHRVLDGPPGQDELERAKRYLAGNFAIDQQRSSGRALQIALDARYGLGANADEDYPQRITAVSTEDVLRVSRRVIDLNAYTLAAIRP